MAPIFLLVILFVGISIPQDAKAQLVCGDPADNWVEYKDEKCFKILVDNVDYEQAKAACRLDIGTRSEDVLPSIHSQEEQLFFNQIVFGDAAVVDNVWLGATRSNESIMDFTWADGTVINFFQNWAPDKPGDNTDKSCAHLKSRLTKLSNNVSIDVDEDGLWADVSCLTSNRVVCQKPQTWSIEQLQATLLQTRDELRKALDNPVPIGFIYIQIANEPNPRTIWPQVVWEDVSASYANLFFRVVGGSTAAMGIVQEDNVPRLSQVLFSSTTGSRYPEGVLNLPEDGWSNELSVGWNGWYGGNAEGWNAFALRYHTLGGEVRPKNTAMRVWRRRA